MEKMTEVRSEDLAQILSYLKEREQTLANYSDKLRKAIIKLEDAITAIDISIDVVDDQPFYESDEDYPDQYYIAIVNHRFQTAIQCALSEYNSTRWISDLSREKIKAFVKSGRLIPFLQKVADSLAVKGEEYREVAEVAEKMAKAVSP